MKIRTLYLQRTHSFITQIYCSTSGTWSIQPHTSRWVNNFVSINVLIVLHSLFIMYADTWISDFFNVLCTVFKAFCISFFLLESSNSVVVNLMRREQLIRNHIDIIYMISIALSTYWCWCLISFGRLEACMSTDISVLCTVLPLIDLMSMPKTSLAISTSLTVIFLILLSQICYLNSCMPSQCIILYIFCAFFTPSNPSMEYMLPQLATIFHVLLPRFLVFYVSCAEKQTYYHPPCGKINWMRDA